MLTLRTVFATTALALGGLTLALGTLGVAYGAFAPTQPPPSLNEGHAYAVVLGIGLALTGSVVGAAGWLLMRRVPRSPSAGE